MMEKLEALQAVWEDDKTRAWFKEACTQPGRTRGVCPGANGEWYMGAEGRIRCKLCDMPL